MLEKEAYAQSPLQYRLKEYRTLQYLCRNKLGKGD